MVTPVMRQNLENRIKFLELLKTPEHQEIVLTLYLSLGVVPLGKIVGDYKSAFGDKEHDERQVVIILMECKRYGMVTYYDAMSADNQLIEATAELTPECRSLMKYLVE